MSTPAELEAFWVEVPECRPTIGAFSLYNVNGLRWCSGGTGRNTELEYGLALAEVACLDWLETKFRAMPWHTRDAVRWFPSNGTDAHVVGLGNWRGIGPTRLAALMDLCRKVKAATGTP